MTNIGPRVKYFRQRFGISQMTLELETGMAFGSVSRLESGENSPNKTTLDRISKVLQLSDLELDYLHGSLINPASDEEIAQAKESVKECFAEKGLLAYLCDERYRFIAYSDTFPRFLGLSKEAEEELATKLFGRTLIEIMLLPELGIRQFLDTTDSQFNLRTSLRSYHQEVSYMVDDPTYLRTLTAIQNDPVANKIWTELEKTKVTTPAYFISERKIYFKIKNFRICLNCSNHYLYKHRRFIITEYAPTNELLKYLKKII